MRVTVTPEVLDKARSGKHSVPDAELRRLAAAMYDPIAVFRSKRLGSNALVVMTELREGDKTVIVAVHLNVAEERHTVNRIASVYGKDRNAVFGGWVRDGLLMYEDEDRLRDWFQSRGLQLPKEGTSPRPGEKIVTKAELVKAPEQNAAADNGSCGSPVAGCQYCGRMGT